MVRTIGYLIMEYFKKHPKIGLKHGPVVDWVEEQYLKLYNKKPRDTWRAVRKLHQEGKLIKVQKGIYKYDPDYVHRLKLYDFPSDIKKKIFERDKYRCVICGLGTKDGVEVCADHIIPRDRGGNNTLENGQTLCSRHNLIKKNYSQTEAGKRYFIKLYKKALKMNDKKMLKFCKDVFDVYNRHKINSHIPRPNND